MSDHGGLVAKMGFACLCAVDVVRAVRSPRVGPGGSEREAVDVVYGGRWLHGQG